VLGGTRVFGGRGRLHGTLIGSVILGVLSTGLILMNVQFFTQLLIPQPEAPLPVNLWAPLPGRLGLPVLRRPRRGPHVEPAFGLSGTHWPHPIALGSFSSPSDHQASCPGARVT
jgi:hypothetical protein